VRACVCECVSVCAPPVIERDEAVGCATAAAGGASGAGGERRRRRPLPPDEHVTLEAAAAAVGARCRIFICMYVQAIDRRRTDGGARPLAAPPLPIDAIPGAPPPQTDQPSAPSPERALI